MAGGPRAQAVVDYLKSIEGADERPAEKPLTPEDAKKLVRHVLVRAHAIQPDRDDRQREQPDAVRASGPLPARVDTPGVGTSSCR